MTYAYQADTLISGWLAPPVLAWREPMLIECKNCGAPLDVSPQRSISKCQYCGIKNRIRETKTLAQVTPPQWQPPPVWQSPSQFGPPQQYAYHHRSPVGAIIAVGMALVVLSVVVVAIVVASDASTKSGHAKPHTAAPRHDAKQQPKWDGKSTIDCKGRSQMTVKGVDIDFGDDDIAYISNDCALEIVDSKLRGKTGLSFAGFHGKLEVTDSEITVAEGTAIHGFGTVTVAGSKIAGERGIAINMNGKVTVIKSEIVAQKDTAISGFSTIVLDASQLRGETGVELGLNGALSIQGGVIEAKGTAIKGSIAHDISCSGATIRGAMAVDISMVHKRGKFDIAGCTTHGNVTQPMRSGK